MHCETSLPEVIVGALNGLTYYKRYYYAMGWPQSLASVNGCKLLVGSAQPQDKFGSASKCTQRTSGPATLTPPGGSRKVRRQPESDQEKACHSTLPMPCNHLTPMQQGATAC
jgi:hypothetical protein